jgi:hypothetical protein
MSLRYTGQESYYLDSVQSTRGIAFPGEKEPVGPASRQFVRALVRRNRKQTAHRRFAALHGR